MKDNPYYTPDRFGLEWLENFEWSDEPYRFDMTVVFKDAEGRFYWADDCGCSCPSPFEDLTREELEHGDLADLRRELEYRAHRDASKSEVRQFLHGLQ